MNKIDDLLGHAKVEIEVCEHFLCPKVDGLLESKKRVSLKLEFGFGGFWGYVQSHMCLSNFKVRSFCQSNLVRPAERPVLSK